MISSVDASPPAEGHAVMWQRGGAASSRRGSPARLGPEAQGLAASQRRASARGRPRPEHPREAASVEPAGGPAPTQGGEVKGAEAQPAPGAEAAPVLDWDDVRFFLGAFEAGSMMEASRRLQVAQATVSRRVAGLEAKIGHALFERSRGGLVPTAAAELLRPHAEAMAAAAVQGAEALSGLGGRPSGVVRLALPPGLAFDIVPPLLLALRSRYPELRLEVLAEDRPVDLNRREAELAIRGERPEDGDLIYRRLPDVPLAVFASPAYVAALGPDPRPAQIDWIQYSEELRHTPLAQWVEERRAGRPVAYASNNFLAMRAAAMAGVGAMVLPRPQGEGLAPIEGIPVDLPDMRWYLVLHRALREVPRIKGVVDLIEEVLAGLGGGAALGAQ